MARQQTLAAPRENCWNKPTSSPHSTERATPVEVGGASAPIQLPLNEGLPSSGRRKSPSQARRTQLQDANLLFWHTVVPLQLLILRRAASYRHAHHQHYNICAPKLYLREPWLTKARGFDLPIGGTCVTNKTLGFGSRGVFRNES